jgi:hypothetical protein
MDVDHQVEAPDVIQEVLPALPGKSNIDKCS